MEKYLLKLSCLFCSEHCIVWLFFYSVVMFFMYISLKHFSSRQRNVQREIGRVSTKNLVRVQSTVLPQFKCELTQGLVCSH